MFSRPRTHLPHDGTSTGPLSQGKWLVPREESENPLPQVPLWFEDRRPPYSLSRPGTRPLVSSGVRRSPVGPVGYVHPYGLMGEVCRTRTWSVCSHTYTWRWGGWGTRFLLSPRRRRPPRWWWRRGFGPGVYERWECLVDPSLLWFPTSGAGRAARWAGGSDSDCETDYPGLRVVFEAPDPELGRRLDPTGRFAADWSSGGGETGLGSRRCYCWRGYPSGVSHRDPSLSVP